MRWLCVLLFTLAVSCDAFTERCLLPDKNGGCVWRRPPWAGSLEYYYGPATIDGQQVLAQRVFGVIIPLEGVSEDRGNAPNPANGAPVGHNTGYERGHVIGVKNGGTDNPQNIVGQPAAWQKNGVWGKLEKDLHDETFELYKKFADWPTKPTYSSIGQFSAPSKLVWMRYTIRKWQGGSEPKYPYKYDVEFRIISVNDAAKPEPNAIPLNDELQYESAFAVYQPLAPRQRPIWRVTGRLDFKQLIDEMIRQHTLENQTKEHLWNENKAREMTLRLKEQPKIWKQIQNKLNGFTGYERERRYAQLLNQIEKRQNQGGHRTEEEPMEVEPETNSNSQNLYVIDYNGDGNVNYMFVEEIIEYVAMFMMWIIALCVLCVFGCVAIYYFCNGKNQKAMMMRPN